MRQLTDLFTAALNYSAAWCRRNRFSHISFIRRL